LTDCELLYSRRSKSQKIVKKRGGHQKASATIRHFNEALSSFTRSFTARLLHGPERSLLARRIIDVTEEKRTLDNLQRTSGEAAGEEDKRPSPSSRAPVNMRRHSWGRATCVRLPRNSAHASISWRPPLHQAQRMLSSGAVAAQPLRILRDGEPQNPCWFNSRCLAQR